MWLQSATGIVYVYLRLEQRPLKQMPSMAQRIRAGTPALAIAAAGLSLAFVLGQLGVTSRWIWVPYLLQTSEVLRGVLLPAMGVKPVAIGMRQLLFKTVFVALFVVLW